MSKKNLIQETVEILEDSPFNYSYPYTSSFDLFASKECNSLVLKVLDNIDGITKGVSQEIKQLSKFLGASPLLIGDHASTGSLEEMIVYKRHDLPAISPSTFEKVVRRKEVFLMQGRGGYYVKLDPKKLKKRRKEENLSINRLSKKTGISSRSLMNYEKDGIASLEKAKELERILGDILGDLKPLRKKVEVKIHRKARSGLAEKFLELGFESLETKKAPFDVCLKDRKETFIVSKKDNKPRERFLKLLRSLEEVIPTNPFFISDKRSYFGDLPAISEKELKKFKDKDDLKENVCA